MKKTLATMLACALLIAGCGKNQDGEVASLKSKLDSAQTELDKQSKRNESLQTQVADLDGKLRDREGDLQELRNKLNDATANDNKTEVEQLQQKVKDLQAEVKQLKADKAAAEKAAAAKPKPEEQPKKIEPAPDPKVKEQLQELLPLIKAATNADSLNKAQALIQNSDKKTRDDFISQIEQWIKDEPNNKHAHMALARVLTARFQDLRGDMMKQATLASQIKGEVDKSLKIDPDYFDAAQYLAIMEANYPTFTSEFQHADAALDKALELQKDMPWDDKFARTYAAYSLWYRKQKKYDEADAKVQAGLALAPRNQELLNEQKAIEDARNSSKED